MAAKHVPAKIHEFASDPFPVDDDDKAFAADEDGFVAKCADFVEKDWGKKPGPAKMRYDHFGVGESRRVVMRCRWEW